MHPTRTSISTTVNKIRKTKQLEKKKKAKKAKKPMKRLQWKKDWIQIVFLERIAAFKKKSSIFFSSFIFLSLYFSSLELSWENSHTFCEKADSVSDTPPLPPQCSLYQTTTVMISIFNSYLVMSSQLLQILLYIFCFSFLYYCRRAKKNNT